MQHLLSRVEATTAAGVAGTVVQTKGETIAVADFPVPIGATVQIARAKGRPLDGEVIGFQDRLTLVYPLSAVIGVRRGDRARLVRTRGSLPVGEGLLGRVVNARGQAIDGRPQPALEARAPLDAPPPPPTSRPRIEAALATGIRVIDGLLTCGRGQRMGIFAGSGVGKSVLLGMMARGTEADVNVIALVGERGREVNDFIERDLGPQGLAKSVLVVATSDEPAIVRVQAARAALSIAEHFRDQGRDVLLLVDSLTRFAMAQREIGLAAGEPPTTRGYPPSVFALLPKLVERAGMSKCGSITGFFSVLVEGDDPQEPVADAVRGLLDGHAWLSRKLASQAHFPAIDVLESISRLMPAVTDRSHQQAAQVLREILAAHRAHEDLISIGAYRRGANPQVDTALAMERELRGFQCQGLDEQAAFASTRKRLDELATRCRQLLAAHNPVPKANSQ
jgi:flagellum-specific ATP synthase